MIGRRSLQKKRQAVAIPFSPFPLYFLKSVSQKFLGIGDFISGAFPALRLELKQAEINLTEKEYGAIIFILASFYFIVIALISALLLIRLYPAFVYIAPPFFGLAAALLILIQLSSFPRITIRKKIRDLERNLIFAMRIILIQLKSGIGLFDALSLVSRQDYGRVSTEIRKAVDEISSGTLEEEALQKLATHDPSPFFRKSLWQLVNGMKSGTDVVKVIDDLVSSLTKEQGLQIRRYGGVLRLFSLVYMMLGVIVPALGITFLIILGSFPQIQMGEIFFWMLLFFLIIGQFLFVGLVKSKRPNLLGAGG